LSSQGSQKHVVQLKDSVPKSSDINQLNKREQKNFVKANVHKAVFELKPEQ